MTEAQDDGAGRKTAAALVVDQALGARPSTGARAWPHARVWASARFWAAARVWAGFLLVGAALLSFGPAPSASAYGPTPAIVVTCAVVGDRAVCTVTGTGFDPNTTVAISSGSSALGSAPSDSSGAFGPLTIVLPCGLGAGPQLFVGTDPEGQVARDESTVPAVAGCEAVLTGSGAAGASGASGASPQSGSSLAFTGADITLTVTVAAVLTALGGMMVASARRRRSEQPSARS